MATSKKATPKKAASKKASEGLEIIPSAGKFILPGHGDKVALASGEMKNDMPIVFEVESATGNEAKNEVVIKPVGNTLATGQWILVAKETEVNY